MRHLSDEDLDIIGIFLDARILRRLEEIMSTLADLVAEDTALQTEVDAVIAQLAAQNALIAQLQGAIGSGTLSPQDQATVDNLFTQLTAQHDAIVAALNPAAPPAPFVVKIAGEDFAAYSARVTAWNADPANATNQVVALDSAAWDALDPVTTTVVP